MAPSQTSDIPFPPELLEKIFTFANDGTRFIDFFDFMLVCRAFRDTVYGMATLWTDFNVNLERDTDMRDLLECLKYWFKRAKELPVTARFVCCDYLLPRQMELLHAFLFSDDTRLLEGLSISLREAALLGAEWIGKFLDASLPAADGARSRFAGMKTVRLGVNGVIALRGHRTLPKLFPSAETLEIVCDNLYTVVNDDGPYIRWPVQLTSANLRELRIRIPIPANHHDEVLDLLHKLLVQLPDIQVLDLAIVPRGKYTEPSLLGPNSPAPLNVTHNSLTDLTLTGCMVFISTYVLPRLTCPKLRALRLENHRSVADQSRGSHHVIAISILAFKERSKWELEHLALIDSRIDDDAVEGLLSDLHSLVSFKLVVWANADGKFFGRLQDLARTQPVLPLLEELFVACVHYEFYEVIVGHKVHYLPPREVVDFDRKGFDRFTAYASRPLNKVALSVDRRTIAFSMGLSPREVKRMRDEMKIPMFVP
ncbi:hypothetical protein CC2G_010901 [Coprinopsis cinerea AmutBmut pab1-1]|nr:hypothetical protein CC2G_010901 [Coprinopsis cinerea AmutBmut pab1-1]